MRIEEGNKLIGHTSAEGAISIAESCISKNKMRTVMLAGLTLGMSNAADAVEIMCIGFIMTEINDATAQQKELLTAAVFMGMLVGGLACGYLSDIIGRKPCLLGSLGVNAIAGCASALAPSMDILIVFRVISGLGIGGSVPIVFAMGAELFPTRIRGKGLSLVAAFWMVGAIYAALTAWIMIGNLGTNSNSSMSWRAYALVSAIPAATSLIMVYYLLPESPRFLLEKREYVRAASALHMYTGVIVSPGALEQADNAVEEENRIFNSPSKEDNHNHNHNHKEEGEGQTSAIKVLFSPGMRSTTIIFMIIWFTLSFGSYGIGTWISSLFIDVGINNPYSASFIFAMANLPGNIVSFMFIETLGRRKLLSIGMTCAAISALAFALDTSSQGVVIACAALFNAFSVMGWNSLDALSCESFPTDVRTSGMGVLSSSGRLGAIAAQFVNGSLEKNVPLLLFVTSTCTLCGGLVSWLLPVENTGAALLQNSRAHKDDKVVLLESTSQEVKNALHNKTDKGEQANNKADDHIYI